MLHITQRACEDKINVEDRAWRRYLSLSLGSAFGSSFDELLQRAAVQPNTVVEMGS